MAVELEVRLVDRVDVGSLAAEAHRCLSQILNVGSVPEIAVLHLGARLSQASVQSLVVGRDEIDVVFAIEDAAGVSLTMFDASSLSGIGEEGGLWATFDLSPLRSELSFALLVALAAALAKLSKSSIVDESLRLTGRRFVTPSEVLSIASANEPGVSLEQAAVRLSNDFGVSFGA